MSSPPDAKDDPPPQAPFTLELNVNGDTWDDLLRILQREVAHIADHGPDCKSYGGGGGGAHSVVIRRRDVSVEQYRGELDEWWQRQRAARTVAHQQSPERRSP